MDTQSSEKIPHLGMIQGIISRFATPSLAIKGLSAALITTGLSVASNLNYKLVIVLAVITLMFSLFDARYLKLKREYKKLYDKVSIKEDKIDYSMSIAKEDKVGFWKTYSSWSVWPYYLLLAVATLLFWLRK